jgi:hypothetical protein
MPETNIVIPAPNIQTMQLEIASVSPIIFHKWSEKAKEMIRAKQAKRVKQPHGVRNPIEEYLASFYYDQEGYICFPALAIKQAVVGAARSIEGLKMTMIRGAIFIKGDQDGLVRVLIDGKPFKPAKKPEMANGEKGENVFAYDPKTSQVILREDMVRVGMGSADLRYRGAVRNWSMALVIRFNADLFSPEQIANLIQTAGFSQGLGEWRPERDGDSGTFEVKSS